MAISKFFGRPDNFAVSISHQTGNGLTRTAECSIWLNGKQLGDAGQSIFVEGFVRGLQGLANALPHVDNMPRKPRNPQDFLSMIEGGEIFNSGRHLFLAIAGFDDFLKLFFRSNQTTSFFWSLHPDCLNMPQYLDTYGHEVFAAELQNSEIERVVSEVLTSGS